MLGVVFDSTILIDLFSQRTSSEKRLRLDGLVKALAKSRTRILIPTPCLTELMIHANKARDKIAANLSNNSTFEIISFDQRAAIECALSLSANWDLRTQRSISRTKFKFDWMVVACAASRNVKTIYSDDSDIKRIAVTLGIKVVGIDDLKLSDEDRQIAIDGV